MLDLSALIQYGAVGILAMVALYAVKRLFEAWVRGDLVPRAIFDRSESRSDTALAQLQRNTEALEANTAVLKDIAKAVKSRDRAST